MPPNHYRPPLWDEEAEHEGTSEAHERRITRCRACNARIIFLTTSTGKNIPVDADTVEPSDTAYVWARHEAHFAKCPNAAQFRKPRG